MYNQSVLNFTELDDKEAFDKLTTLKQLFFRGEEARVRRLTKAEESIRIWRKSLWSDADLSFFREIGVQPYQFQIHRPLINSLINVQRSQAFEYIVTPTDTESIRRKDNLKKQFVEQKIATGEFSTEEEAAKYYESFGDDIYTKAVSGLLQQIRNESNAPDVEADTFENGVITGADFLKVHKSTKHNREGSLEISRKSQRGMIWDDRTVEYNLSDIEYIGEVHVMYKDQIIQLYPEYKEQIEKHFEQYTNKNAYKVVSPNNDYKQFYNFETGQNVLNAKIAELYVLQTEERYRVKDLELGSQRMVEFGMTDEQVWDKLLVLLLEEKKDLAERTRDFTLIKDPNLKEILAQEAIERFELEKTYEPVWTRAVFSYDVLFEYSRVVDHPYVPFFCQFTDGYFTGIIDDSKDVIIALNKAMMFRELMMAHGSKGMLVVDQNALTASGYDLDDIADAYTRIGSVIALKPRAGVSIDKTFFQTTNLNTALGEVNSMINDYFNQLRFVIGINEAQLGQARSDTPTSRFRLELAQGQGNNGIIFDNFQRTLKLFYKKTVPLVVELMKERPEYVKRALGDQYNDFINYKIDEDYNMFVDALRQGMFTLTLVTQSEDPQITNSRASQYMQLALANPIEFPIEVAIEAGDDPNKYKILKRIKEIRKEKEREQAAQSATLQQVQQIAVKTGLNPEQVDELVKKLQQDIYKNLRTTQNQAVQSSQGIGEIQRSAQETTRQQTINNSIQA